MGSRNLKLSLVMLALIILIAITSAIGYFQNIKSKNQGSVALMITVLNDSDIHKYNFENLTALELLQLNNKVNTTYSKFGAFVNCINDICSDSNNYWIYYVNGELAAVGAAEYRVKDNDTIEFRYGKIG